MKKLVNIIITVIISIEIFLVSLFTVPKILGLKTYVVTSGSMIPKYPIGSMIYVKNTNIETIKVGDAITFYVDGSNIVATHEVYKIDKNKFYTQGINNLDETGNIIHDALPVSQNNIIGKPIFCIPYIGYINRFVTTSPGLYIMIAFTILMVCALLAFENKEKKMEVQNEKK